MKRLILAALLAGGTAFAAGTNVYQVLYDGDDDTVTWAPGETNTVDEIKASSDINTGYMVTTQLQEVAVDTGVPAPVTNYWDDGGVTTGFSFEVDRIVWRRSYELDGAASIGAYMYPKTGSNKDLVLHMVTNGIVIYPGTTLESSSSVPTFFYLTKPLNLSSGDYVQVWVENATDTTDIEVDPGASLTVRK